MKSLLIGLALIIFVVPQLVTARAPQIKTQAPAYYRFMIGDIEVTTLLDGTFPMKVGDVLANTTSAEVTRLLAQAYQGPQVITSVNGFLINTGTRLVLVDTGTGKFMGPTVGHLIENLKASGYQPEQVDEIYLTHMHSDHLGGLTTDGKKNFPNAVLRVDRRESEFWLSDSEAAKVTNSMMKSMFTNAKATFAPYQADGKFKPFDGDTELVTGVHAHAAYGHTPGHTVYTVESKNQKLWLFGDMIHVAAVQFPVPAATLVFDWNSKLAASERMKDFTQAAKANDMIAAAHLAFPGVGHIRKVASTFSFTPLAYAPVAEAAMN